MNNKIKQLATTANIINLSMTELSDAANREAQSGDECFQRGLLHYKACGEYLIAAKAKGKQEIGSKFRWSVWLEENWSRHHSVAARFMKLARDWEKITVHGNFSEDMGYDAALKLVTLQPETIDVEVIETVKEVEKEVVKEKVVTQVKEDTKSKKQAEIAQKALANTKSENDKLLEHNQQLKRQLEQLQKQSDEVSKLKEQLKQMQIEFSKIATQKPQIVEKVKKVVPEDYEQIKKELAQLKQNNNESLVMTREQIDQTKETFKSIIADHYQYFLKGIGNSVITPDEVRISQEIADFLKKYL